MLFRVDQTVGLRFGPGTQHGTDAVQDQGVAIAQTRHTCQRYALLCVCVCVCVRACVRACVCVFNCISLCLS